MSATAKLFFPPGQSVIPQMDFECRPTENGGFEATQTFLVKKSALSTVGPLFIRGKSITQLDPNCPLNYAFLGLKSAPQSDYAPGVLAIRCVFTGYGAEGSNGSSGEELTVPTYSLRKDIEEVPLNEHRKWGALSDACQCGFCPRDHSVCLVSTHHAQLSMDWPIIQATCYRLSQMTASPSVLRSHIL